MAKEVSLTGIERRLGPEEIIVSKTDLQGRITYANQVFLNISGYTEAELLGQPHNLIRHPHMPRCVFWLLWSTIQAGQEIFAYVINRAKNGDHYWVLAHVTPSHGASGQIIGYHSNRRMPQPAAVVQAQALYDQLLAEEQRVGGKEGMQAAVRLLQQQLASLEMTYDEFVWSLTNRAEMNEGSPI